MHKLLRILSAGLVLAMPLLAAPTVLAASATMSLSPASGSETKGSTFTVSIYENSGSEPVNAASADLSYPANLLSFVSISSSSAFSIVAANSGGGGSVTIDRGALPAVSGNQLVASVRFKALTDTGTASVSFTGGSKVVSANSNGNILAGTGGGNYTLKAPAPTPPAAPPPPKDTTPPTITAVAVGSIGINSATVTWTTSEPASSEVDYGLNTSYGLTAGNNNYVTAHSLVLNSALLTPGTQYHYVVKSVDPSGNAASGQDLTFTTKGATLAVTVIDQNKKPVSNAKVTIDNASGVTNSKGEATLTGLSLGNKAATVDYKGKQTVSSIEVKPISASGAPQALTLSIQKPSSHALLIVLPLLLLAALVAVVALRGKKNGPFGGGSASSSSKSSNGSSPKAQDSTKNASNSSRTASGPTVIKPTIPPRS